MAQVSGATPEEVEQKITEEGGSVADYKFYSLPDGTVVGVPSSEAAPEGATPLNLQQSDADLNLSGVPETGVPAPTAETPEPVPTAAPPSTGPAAMPRTAPMEGEDQRLMEGMRKYRRDTLWTPIRKTLGKAFTAMGHGVVGKDPSYQWMNPKEKQAQAAAYAQLLMSKEEAVAANLRSAGQATSQSLDSYVKLHQSAQNAADTRATAVMRKAEEEAKLRSRNLYERLDQINNQLEGGWELGLWGREGAQANVNTANFAGTLLDSNVGQLIGKNQINITNDGEFLRLLKSQLGTMNADARAAFVYDINKYGIDINRNGSTTNMLQGAYSKSLDALLGDAWNRVEQTQKIDFTLKQEQEQLKARLTAEINAVVQEDPIYKKHQAAADKYAKAASDASATSGSISYRLAHGGTTPNAGQPITEQSWSEATGAMMRGPAPAPTAAPAPGPEPAPAPVEPAPEEAPAQETIQDGQYTYVGNEQDGYTIYEGDNALKVDASPGSGAYQNILAAKAQQTPAPAPPVEASPAPAAAPAPEGEESPAPPSGASGESKIPTYGAESPEDKVKMWLEYDYESGTGVPAEARMFRDQLMAPGGPVQKHMDEKGIKDPRRGWRSFRGEFFYKLRNQNRYEKQRLDEETIKSGRGNVLGAKIRQGARKMFGPKDAAGNPITHFERENFVPPDNPSAVAVGDTPQDKAKGVPENKDKDKLNPMSGMGAP